MSPRKYHAPVVKRRSCRLTDPAVLARRDRRSPNAPAAASSTPPPSVASHGTGPGPPGPGAVPPIPVAAPPLGALGLPAASVRLPIFSLDPEAASSTTIVCTEPA